MLKSGLFLNYIEQKINENLRLRKIKNSPKNCSYSPFMKILNTPYAIPFSIKYRSAYRHITVIIFYCL